MGNGISALDNEVAARAFETAVENAFHSIMITEGDDERHANKIVFVNDAFTEMTGYTAEEVIGKTPGILQGPKTDQKVIDELRGTMEKGVAFHGKTINYRKNGSEFMIEWKVFPVRDREGSITNHVAVQRDITSISKPET